MSNADTQSRDGRVSGAWPVLSILFLLGACVLGLAAGWNQNHLELGLLALGSLTAALIVYPWRGRGQSFQITEAGLQLLESGNTLAWDNLTACSINDSYSDPREAGTGPVIAHFGDRKFPLRCDDRQLKPSKLYEQLWQIILSGYQADLKSPLHELYQAEVAKHSPENVVAARWVKQMTPFPQMGMFIVGVAVFCGSAILAAMLTDRPVVSVVCAVTSGIIFAIVFLLWLIDNFRHSSAAQATGDGIVLSPSRLILKIPKLRGEMKWSELKGIELKPNAKRPKFLRLKLAGVDIDLQEEFQLPLWHLYQCCWNLIRNQNPDPIPENASAGIATNLEVIEDSNPYRAPQG